MLDRDTFGPHLRQLRLRAGLTQGIAANHAGVRRATWHRWEHGGLPELHRAPTIARALGITLTALLADDPERVAVADVTIGADVLERVRKHGAPEVERVAASLAEQLAGRITTLATASRTPVPERVSRYPGPVARDVRTRVAEHRRRRALLAPPA
jgi:DNA-binding XRE family transcriptional regulator